VIILVLYGINVICSVGSIISQCNAEYCSSSVPKWKQWLRDSLSGWL